MRRSLYISSVLLLSVSITGVYASDTRAWQQVASGIPSARSGHAMAYDPERGRTVLFGGVTQVGIVIEYFADTWEWNGLQWTCASVEGPSARVGHGMAYDSARQCMVLFGGYCCSGDPHHWADTWTWDGVEWLEVSSSGPPARTGHAMAYDQARQRIVLFGGGNLNEGIKYGDTWEWDGSSWLLVSTTGPHPRSLHAVAYDSFRQRVVLFGGSAGTHFPSDTWEWDGEQWNELSNIGPTARLGHAMAYHSGLQRVVLFGGTTAGDETWEWDGIVWTQMALSSRPKTRYDFAMAFDQRRQQVVLFGGYNLNSFWQSDTWTYFDPTAPLPLSTDLVAYALSGYMPSKPDYDQNSDSVLDVADIVSLIQIQDRFGAQASE